MSDLAAFVRPHLGAPNLRRVTLSGMQRGAEPAIRKAVLRPVEVKGERVLQLVSYDQRRSTTANVAGPGAPEVAAMLELPFRHATVELTTEILQARVTKRGGLVTTSAPTAERPVVLSHDRVKARPIPEDAPFLEVLEISVRGRVKPSRHAKYTQINEFVRVLDGASSLDRLAGGDVVRVIDFGSGNAYLTFAVYHYFTEIRKMACHLTGVDRDAELVERGRHRADSLGWDGLRFETGAVESFVPEEPPHVVIALHACDTASDHALAAVVRWQAELGLVAPCCHHHVQAQLQRSSVDAAESLLLRHGIVRERMGDVLTEAARATIMRLVGYDVDVIEFVSPEDTPKNLLIRAARQSLATPPELVQAYRAMTTRWAIEPLLGTLLAEELAARGLVGPAPARSEGRSGPRAG